jgi:nucleoside-diphosphate-sugar epimerase
MRFLVTGASGQDGMYLVTSLKLAGHDVVEVGRNRSKFFRLGQIVEGDSPKLEDPIAAAEFLNSQKPDCILHFAAVHYPTMLQDGESNQDRMFACHVTATQNLLDWMVSRENCKMIVALSSQMYSTKDENQVIHENSDHQPVTFYGKTKSEAHNLIRQYSDKYQVNAAGAIFFNHTSIRSKADFLFPILAKSISNSIKNGFEDITIRNSNSYLDIGSSDEYCEGVLSMLAENCLTDYIFSSGQALKISSIVEDAFLLMGLQGKMALLSESTDTSWCLVGDNRKARENLLWKPQKSPSEILVDMIYNLNAR